MTDLPKTRKDELLARIGELETEVKRQHDLHDRAEIARKALYQRAEQAEATLDEVQKLRHELQHKLDDSRAALAERDRMLRLAVELLAGMVSDHGPRDVTEDEVLADLKARAEESHEGIDEDAPICPECRVSDVMGTGTKHLRSCSRADEAKP